MDEGKRKKEIELLMEEFARLRVEDINCQNAKFELEERIAENERYRRRQIIGMVCVFLLAVVSLIIGIMRCWNG